MPDITPTPRNTPIAMPKELQGKYRFTRPIYGGPLFDFPQWQLYKVNLAELNEAMAARLLRKGWAGIAEVSPSESMASTARQPSPKAPE